MTDAADTSDENAADLDALRRCVAEAMKDRDRAGQIIEMLAEPRPWIEVAKFCAYSVQCDSLRLRPWQDPPVHSDGTGRDRNADALAYRLRRANLSVFEPHPLEALAAAEKPKRTP